MSYLAGLSAEDIVAREYARRGMPVLAHRWRGAGGEIDLIAQDGDGFIFVEVKASRTHDRAAERVTRRQMDRICVSACDYVGRTPRGMLSDMRFDVATIDGQGSCRIIENAFGAA